MIKVLIVDDHPAVGEGTKAIIEQEEDIQAEVILDSENILEVINKDHYDVYLLDLYMPKLNGIELSKVILQNDPDAKILIYTGFNIAEHYNLLIEAGVSGFISKTETKEQLIYSHQMCLKGRSCDSSPIIKTIKKSRYCSDDERRSAKFRSDLLIF